MRDVTDDMSHQLQSDVLLAADELVFAKGQQRLIDNLSVCISAGRRTVILGHNGAGKSLLLRLLHGLIAPDRGRVLWRGNVLDKAARRQQAMVFQRPIMLRRSVAANLDFALKVRGLTRGDRAHRVAALLDQAGMTHLATRPATVLSGGEKQRLSIARALACEPAVLFLDEPTASLDPASALAVEQQVLAANADGITTVMVTHDAGQARRVGQDCIFLHAGRVVETGPVEDVLTRPKSPAATAWRDGRIYID